MRAIWVAVIRVIGQILPLSQTAGGGGKASERAECLFEHYNLHAHLCKGHDSASFSSLTPVTTNKEQYRPLNMWVNK